MKYRRTKESKPIPVLLDKGLRARIEMMSEKMGEAKSTVMRIAMRLGLASLEKTFAENPEKLTQEALRSAAYPEHQPSGLLLNETRKTLSSSKGISDKTRKEIEDAALRDLNAVFPPKESK